MKEENKIVVLIFFTRIHIISTTFFFFFYVAKNTNIYVRGPILIFGLLKGPQCCIAGPVHQRCYHLRRTADAGGVSRAPIPIPFTPSSVHE
jgi:hypothetical protein